jgi:hypothetical protein
LRIFWRYTYRFFECNINGYEYQLAAVDGDIVSVIIEDKSAVQGECVSVSVRVAGNVRIRLQPMTVCEDDAQEYPEF